MVTAGALAHTHVPLPVRPVAAPVTRRTGSKHNTLAKKHIHVQGSRSSTWAWRFAAAPPAWLVWVAGRNPRRHPREDLKMVAYIHPSGLEAPGGIQKERPRNCGSDGKLKEEEMPATAAIYPRQAPEEMNKREKTKPC
ncbi:unnamed protein product [Triticum turgidum subsp. durum]|uniref:Uncharacterized protein n=1 Tax=Triticum turgidum subsp. durum TaxID=4567 RepID=A0A9R1NIK0_TRITD|nr:unnamed protein product [Triticum turgidum subsp. durum]